MFVSGHSCLFMGLIVFVLVGDDFLLGVLSVVKSLFILLSFTQCFGDDGMEKYETMKAIMV